MAFQTLPTENLYNLILDTAPTRLVRSATQRVASVVWTASSQIAEESTFSHFDRLVEMTGTASKDTTATAEGTVPLAKNEGEQPSSTSVPPQGSAVNSTAELITSASQTIINLAVACAVLLKQSPIPDVLSHGLETLLAIVKDLDRSYDMKVKIIALAEFMVKAMIYVATVLLTAMVKSIVAYRQTPKYQPPPHQTKARPTSPSSVSTTTNAPKPPTQPPAPPSPSRQAAALGPSSSLRRIKSLIDFLPNLDDRAVSPSSQDAATQTVTFSVGGHKFTTTLETVRANPNSRLAQMFDSGGNVDGNGEVFIDRDGTHFRHILNLLRGVNTIASIDDASALEELLVDADFYQLPAVTEAVTRRRMQLSMSTRGIGATESDDGGKWGTSLANLATPTFLYLSLYLQSKDVDYQTSVPDPNTWATSGDPITDRQKAFLETLASSKGEEVDLDISKGEASKKIDELKSGNPQPESSESTSSPQHNAATSASTASPVLVNPKKWTTGEEPHTERQERFLKVLERDAGEKVDVEGLTKAEASEKIEELKEKAGRD
ncbi:BTB/POZ domain-containing protein kctd21 [Rhizophlyctis rosea]|nr:BTB/POZ domain-containing protein kctd21 [Rhizophlyctis rosea]